MPGSPIIQALTGQPYATIAEVWNARVGRSPGSPCLIFGEERWTYAQAARQVSAFARDLVDLAGIRPGDRVASYLGNRPSTLWTWLASASAGACYCPLNRAHKGLLLADMMSRSGAAVLVTDKEGLAELQDAAVSAFRAVLTIDGSKLSRTANQSAPIACPGATPEVFDTSPFQEGAVIYTSGSTGRSRAVRLSHVALTHGAGRVVEAWEMDSEDVFHAWLPHFHIAGLLHQSLATIVAGGTIALYPTFSASRFWAQIRAVKATIVIGLPNVVSIAWNAPEDPTRDASSLRLWITTAINPAIHQAFERRFNLHLLDQYGMTEAELVTLPRVGEQLAAGSCGRPGPDWQVAIVNEHDAPLPTGRTGQIVLRPRIPGILMLGYDGDDAATAEALRNAWFHCGDTGFIDSEGCLHFVDRRKHTIRRRGENISSLELERLIEQHPSVACCAAVGMSSALGEDEVKVVLEPRPGAIINPAELRTWCVQRMAKFMVPRFIEVLSAMPRTPVGKPNKDQMRSPSGREWDAEEKK